MIIDCKNNNWFIDDQQIHDEVFDAQKTEFYPEFRTDFIDKLVVWAAEAQESSSGDYQMMMDDLQDLQNRPDTYMLSSMNTNEYLFESDGSQAFMDAIAEIIEVNNEHAPITKSTKNKL
jgi:hypothetical protein